MTATAALIALLMLVPCYGSAQASSDIAAIELAAARHLLGRHPSWAIHLDSMFVQAGTAPGVRTMERRPVDRTLALADSLGAFVRAELTERPILLQLSDPLVRDSSARVSVTVGYLRANGGRRRGFYETVDVIFERDGKGWKVVGEAQLGIT
ncbi:MAG: hypothetical protein ACREOK_13960 [Gemmatimonadaceae bacterium]